MDFGIASVAGITVICYLIGQIIKATGLDNKWIPCIVGTAGAALGAVGMYIMPDFPAGDALTGCPRRGSTAHAAGLGGMRSNEEDLCFAAHGG